MDVVDKDAGRKLSRTVVSSAPRYSAWVVCVWRIQCGVARRSFSASVGFVSASTSAVEAKNLFTIARDRLALMPASPSRLPSKGVAGFHFGRRNWEAALSQVPVQTPTPQHHLAGLAAFADDVQPSIADVEAGEGTAP